MPSCLSRRGRNGEVNDLPRSRDGSLSRTCVRLWLKEDQSGWEEGSRGRGLLSPGHRAVQRGEKLLLRRECGSSHHVRLLTPFKVSIAKLYNSYIVFVTKKRTPVLA